MKAKDIFGLALTSIRHRHLRSWLTILGIVIGVASIITLIGISLGISSQISSRLNTLGSNIITISAGGQQASRMGGGMFVRPTAQGPGQNGREGASSTPAITFREAEDLRTLPGVYKLDTRIQKREEMQYRDKNSSLTVTGTDPAAFKDSIGISMLYGRYLNPSDQYSAVIGFGVANQTFNDLDILNKQVKINGVPFHVVGILNESGGGGFGSADQGVYIPLKTAKDMFNQTTDVSQIIVVVSPDHDTDTVASELENELIILHRVTKDTEDFTISTAATLESTVSSVTDTLGLLLGGIASISLLVGGIGVANTMFMSVLEQTRDIGVYKSLGAKNRDVVYMFLCEAAIIGFVGGFLGVVLSFAVSWVLGSFGVPVTISTELVLGGLFFSVVIGVIAGWAPARNAASIPPVEALRYE
jgi:putative ABC transport system permease protein